MGLPYKKETIPTGKRTKIPVLAMVYHLPSC